MYFIVQHSDASNEKMEQEDCRRIAGRLQEDCPPLDSSASSSCCTAQTQPLHTALVMATGHGQLKANTPRGDTDHAPTGHTEIRYRKITHLSLTFDNFDSETRGLKPLRVLEQLSTRR